MINIETAFKDLKLNIDTYIPIGNHELKRHLVYEFCRENIPYIIKVYYKSNRVLREVEGLKVAKRLEIPCPKVIQYGNLNSGFEYIIMSKCQGEIMDKKGLSIEEKMPLYEKIGESLGKIHSYDTGHTENFKLKFINNVKKYIEEIRKLNLKSADLRVLERAYYYFMKNIEGVDFSYIPAGYCHNDFDERNIMVEEGNISGIIDFEISGKGNLELDLMPLYWKVLHKYRELEESFLRGYEKYMGISENFHKRKQLYYVAEAVGNCTWSYEQSPEYFRENIEFLRLCLKRRI